MSNNVSGTSGTSRTCSTRDDDDDRVHNEEQATLHAQRLVNALSPNRLKESGKGDAETERALKAFQNDHGLSPTGKADGATLAKLEAAVHAQDAHEHGAEEPTAKTAHTKTDGIGGAPQYVGHEVTYQGRASHASPATKPAAVEIAPQNAPGPEIGGHDEAQLRGASPQVTRQAALGASLRDGVTRVKEAAKEGGAASNVGQTIHDAGKRGIEGLRAQGQVLGGAALKFKKQVEEKGLRGAVKEGAKQAYEGGKNWLELRDPRKAIGELKENETYEIKGNVGAALGIEPDVYGGLEERASLKVTRDATGYTVEVSGEAAMQASGGEAGKKGEVSAEVSAGAKVTFHAATKEEALRLARIGPQAALEMGSMIGAAELRRYHKELSAADKAFLKDHCTALTFTGGEAVAFAKEAGETKGVLSAGVEGKVKGSISESVTVNLDHGKVTGFTMEATLSAEGSARAAGGVRKPGEPDEHGKREFKMVGKLTSVGLEAGAKVQVRVSRHFDLKPGATTSGTSPRAFAKSLASRVDAGPLTASVSFEGKVEGNASLATKEGTVTASATLVGISVTPALVGKLATGDLPGAIRGAGPNATAEVKVGSYEEEGKIEDKGAADGDGSFKLKAGLSASKRHDVTKFQIKGTPSEVLDQAWDGSAPPKHTQLDTNVQDQRYARVAG